MNRLFRVRADAPIRNVFLTCGILSSLVYVAANLLGPMVWDGYNSASQTVSELSAIDAPSRPLTIVLMVLYSVLVMAFGLGVWQSAGSNHALRRSGLALMAFGLVCMTGPLTPMHQREVLAVAGRTLTDRLHLVSTVADVLLIVLTISFGAASFGKRFSRYSITTIVVLLLTGSYAGTQGSRLEANLPTPWAGAAERISIGLFLLWVVVFAVALMRSGSREKNRI